MAATSHQELASPATTANNNINKGISEEDGNVVVVPTVGHEPTMHLDEEDGGKHSTSPDLSTINHIN